MKLPELLKANPHITLAIEKKEEIAERVSNMVKAEVTFKDISDFIRNEENTLFAFDRDMRSVELSDYPHMVWLDTGFTIEDKPIFISLLAEGNYISGYFVGSGERLVEKKAARYPADGNAYKKNYKYFTGIYESKIKERVRKHQTPSKNETSTPPMTMMGLKLQKMGYSPSKEIEDVIEIEEATCKAFVPQKELTDVTPLIHENILINNFVTMEGLDRYIKIIGSRLIQLIDKKSEEYYVLNNIRSAVVNTGLFNMFGQDCLVMYRYNEKYGTYIAHKIIEGRKDYLDNGFTQEQATKKLQPITFYDENNSEFKPYMEKFDINYHSLTHIIEERRERFPEELRKEPAARIAINFSSALERGLHIAQIDRTYAKPSYSAKTGKVNWYLPLHINKHISEEPELVMVIVMKEDYYQIKTILPYDNEIKDRITAMELYGNTW